MAKTDALMHGLLLYEIVHERMKHQAKGFIIQEGPTAAQP